MPENIQEILDRIRREAVKKVRKVRAKAAKGQKSSVTWESQPEVQPLPVEPAAPPPRQPGDVELFREVLQGAVSKAIINKASRLFADELIGDIQEVVRNHQQQLGRDVDFTDAARGRDGKILLYPDNCRFLTINEAGKGSFVVEYPPERRSIFVGYEHKNYFLAMPYIVFVVSFQEGARDYQLLNHGVGMRTEPLRSIDDPLCLSLLPHSPELTGICMPLERINYNTLTDMTREIVRIYWASDFRYAFGGFTLRQTGEKIGTYRQWEQRSEKNPLFILDAELYRSQTTLRNLLGRIQGVTERRRLSVVAQVQGMVSRIVGEVGRKLSPDELNKFVQETMEQVLDQAIRDSFPNSALQPEKNTVQSP